MLDLVVHCYFLNDLHLKLDTRILWSCLRFVPCPNACLQRISKTVFIIETAVNDGMSVQAGRALTEPLISAVVSLLS